MSQQLAVQNQLLAAPITAGTLESYIAQVNQIPVLDADQERDLAERLFKHGDLEAARQLIISNLRFVTHIARGYSGYGLPLADLVQEGNVGLMKAVKRFDPGVGVRLVSFAVHWIRAEIHEFVIKNWRIVKIATTKAQRKLFFNLRKFKDRLGWFSKDEIDAVANDLGVLPREVLEMEKRLSAYDAGFEADADDDNQDHRALAPAEYLKSSEIDPAEQVANDQWEAHTQTKIHNALALLDERSQNIINSRWMAESKATLHELADEYGVSAERIRQIENNAIKKLQAAVV